MYNWLKNGLILIFTLSLVIVLNWHTLPVFSQLTQNIKPVTEVQKSPQSMWQPREGNWKPVPSHRKDRGAIKVVWLQGTPYEMGYQHGKLLHNEIASMDREVMSILSFFGKLMLMSKLAKRNSFPGIDQECQGLVDATSDIGMTMDACMVLAFGDVFKEIFSYTLPNILFHDGCANFAATGDATTDGHLYHGRTLDNNQEPIKYWIDNTTVFVRQPQDGIPHMIISVPGMVWPNSGLNAEGISISLDTAHPKDIEAMPPDGRSNVQLMSQVMKNARTYEDARAIMAKNKRLIADLIMITDGKSRKAGVFELLNQEMGVRELEGNGTIYMTNHFLSPEVKGKDSPPVESTLSRYQRFEQLLSKNGSQSRYGKINASEVVKILRDRTNPKTKQASPLSVFDDNASIGGNGSLRQAIFDPERLLFWIAAGKVPVPQNQFTCFSLGKMLGLPKAQSCPAKAIY